MPSQTTWKLFKTNEDAWNSMLADCAKATKSIDLEQFIFANDDFGKRMIDICSRRAAEGVEVRFLWDAAGSFSFFGSTIAEDLKQKGIELLFWKTLVPSFFKVQNFRSWYLRNHRRTLVIDETTGYTGSMCVNDQMKNWRDTNVRIQGDVVREMSNAFERMWARAKKSRPLPKRIYARDTDFRYVTNYPAPGRRHIYTDILDALRSAHQYVYITMPYFVPTRRLAHALERAAKHGADVRIIIPEKSDYYAVDLGARSYFTQLLEAGVRIYLYSDRMIHSKAIVIDGTWATVGSLNLDRASLFYNFEANLTTANTKFADELAGHFIHDMNHSTEVLLHEWKSRLFIEKVPEILIRLFRKFL